MTEIERKALALVNEVFTEKGGSPIDYAALEGPGDVVTLALCRAIEQHEAFRQEVSFALETFKHGNTCILHSYLLDPFIIAKPDPLVEAMNEALLSEQDMGAQEMADSFRAALAARGGKIVWGDG